MEFKPIYDMRSRIEASKEESDTSYFYDLVAYAEMVVKITALFLVSNIEENTDRTRYRYEYQLVRADGIGDFSKIIIEIITGSAADYLVHEVSSTEKIELQSRWKEDSWQYKALSTLDECCNILDIEGRNHITKKSSLLIWFTNIATLRNKTKGHGSVTLSQCSKVCSLLDDSITTVFKNLSLFQRPWAYLYQNLSGKYRVSLINGDSSKFNHLKTKNNYTYSNGIYCYTDTIRPINLFFSDENLSKFQLVNGNFSESDKFEVLDYVTNSRNKMDGSQYLVPPTRLPDSITSSLESISIKGNAFTNIPSGLSDYINRSELETELKRVLIYDDRYPIITLKGRGGIGKTSLAIEVINQIITEQSSRFDIIVWFSARDVDLLPEGPKQVQADVITPKDIATEYFKQVEATKPNSKNIVEEFSNEMTHSSLGNILFIFDNFETLSNPVETFEWIDSYIRLPNKVLITSRMNRNFKADYPIEVSGMNEDQCLNLIQLTSKKLGIEDKLTDSYKSSLLEESDGHPYIIKVILGEAAIKSDFTSPQRVVASKDAVLDALFKRTYSTLSKSAKRVFLTLCSWRSVIPQIALESVLLRPENEKMDVDKALDDLNKSSFIEIEERTDDSFIRVPMAASFFGRKELDVSPDKMDIMRDKRLLVEFGAGTARGTLTLRSHIQRKIKAINNRIQNIGELYSEIPSLECLTQKYPYVWIDIADLYHRFSISEKEKEAIRELLKSNNDDSINLNCWKRLSSIALSEGNWKEESAALMEICEITNVPYEEISYIASRINKYYSENNDSDIVTKNAISNKCKDVLQGRIREANAVDCSRLAWLCLNLTDEANALKYAHTGLKMDPNNLHCKNIVNRLSGV